MILTEKDANNEVEYRTEQATINIAQDTTDDTMAPVTIYNSNHLGISISVEEPESQPNGSSANWEKQKSTVCNSGRKFPNPFKRLGSATQLKCFDVEKNAERVALVDSREANKDSLSPSGRSCQKSPQQKRPLQSRRQLVQGRVYMFLEHPVGWICFVYHMAV